MSLSIINLIWSRLEHKHMSYSYRMSSPFFYGLNALRLATRKLCFAFATAFRKLCEMERPGALQDFYNLWSIDSKTWPILSKLSHNSVGCYAIAMFLDVFATAPMLPPCLHTRHQQRHEPSCEAKTCDMSAPIGTFQGADSLPAMRLGSIFPLVSTAMTLEEISRCD